jgi:hypothetical protein
VWRHAESDNLCLCAVLLELDRVVALMAVKNEQTIGPNSALFCMLVKVLQPLYTKLICCLAVLRDPNNPILRQTFFLIPDREVVLALKDNKGWDRPASCANTNHASNPLSVALL